jgi:hypothetical protein
MIDPFPLAVPRLIGKLSQPIADFLSLPTLPLHAHEILFAFYFYHTINKRISPWVSSRLFPSTYNSLNARSKINWDVHVVSFVQSTFIIFLALWVMWKDEERAAMDWKGRVFGYTGACGMIQAFAGGYFLWDLMVSSLHFDIFGPGLLAHAVSALAVYALGFRPFVNFYAPNFILYELSSPFLNIHWFMDKLNMTGSRAQLYNGIVLLVTFFGCRLIWGMWQSGCVTFDVYRAFISGRLAPGLGGKAVPAEVGEPGKDWGPDVEIMRFIGDGQVPLWLCGSYLAANFTLNLLNVYWFKVMIDALRKRFEPPFGTKGVHDKKRKEDAQKDSDADVVMAAGIDADGRKSVEVLATEVRNRRRG